MPKMKTKRALKKRVHTNANGDMKRAHAYRSHRATGKTTKEKRHLEKATYIKRVDKKRLESLLQD
ncbi:50S ribosomal protein L35 [Mesoplasma lactucae]|uniref:Large ribosomal subunit protein bL35 n=1 Tax=Mesoplasma lactucae ATCC 49193 TaxID=81460 RepID=A0A291IQM7_9MOLU|nr:50S ribosomal protein L35 [Mesoplasma lactucae]ATG97235.1 50S ribosomal protein L35 [Mesoplasma lactucae ATCC 49193]ATZ20322.1 50S ribosomal protein L35 [Mesoplasma lactucae ATCC 49193]MCL8216493.1 50S ribosomal protein L35 [Mesoplasma lactucae ATCC 49193]